MRTHSPSGAAAAAMALLAGAFALSSAAFAQVPDNLAAANRAIGKANDQPATAKLYGPLAEAPPFPEARIVRDLAYGPDPKHRLDVFQPTQAGPPRAVVIYVSGGMGMRLSGDPGLPTAGSFYDNIMLWAVKHDLVGVNTDRRPWQNMPWDTGARDVAAMIQWVRGHIGEYGGDPQRVFVFGHGYGGTQVATYLAHPEFWNGTTTGLKGAILISAPFNLAPLLGAGSRSGNPMFDPAHSNLQGLKAVSLPLYLGSAQFDEDETAASAELLRQQLCLKACPGHDVYADHQHISVTYSFNTADESVSGAVLRWMRGIH